MSQVLFSEHREGRYDRQQLINWWDQKRLSDARLVVAGVGALGNEVLKLLALMGVGHILIVDFDVIAASNLNRMVLFRDTDIGKSKAHVAADRIHDINPEVEVRPIHGDLRFAVGTGELRSADLVIGCLDSVNARWALNRRCMLAGVDWINGGISDFHGQVERYSPDGGACYECNFTGRTVERFSRRYSCPFGLVTGQAEDKVPTTAVTSSIIAAFQVQQAIMMLHNVDDGLQPGERLTVYVKPFFSTRDRLPFNADCLAHQRLPNDIPAVHCAPGARVIDVLRAAEALHSGVRAIKLPADVVAAFVCASCGERQPVMRPRDMVLNAEAVCPTCGITRTPDIVETIELGSPLEDVPLDQLGVPYREILTIVRDGQDGFVQFGE